MFLSLFFHTLLCFVLYSHLLLSLIDLFEKYKQQDRAKAGNKQSHNVTTSSNSIINLNIQHINNHGAESGNEGIGGSSNVVATTTGMNGFTGTLIHTSATFFVPYPSCASSQPTLDSKISRNDNNSSVVRNNNVLFGEQPGLQNCRTGEENASGDTAAAAGGGGGIGEGKADGIVVVQQTSIIADPKMGLSGRQVGFCKPNDACMTMSIDRKRQGAEEREKES